MNESHSEQPDDNITTGFSTLKLMIMSLVSANVYVFFSFLIIRYWHDGGVLDLFDSQFSILEQSGIGVCVGLGLAGIVYFVIGRSPVKEIISEFSVFKRLSKAEFSFFDNAQISIFAGAGEELLFRGALQPLLGNTITSIIFIGIHSYFKFKKIGHIIFGAMMFSLSFTLGLLFEQVGLITAMIAHSIYDVVLLVLLQKINPLD